MLFHYTVDVIIRPLSTVGYTSVASLIHCRQGLTNIIQDHSPEGSATQVHECSVFWKTPLFSERKYTLLGSKVAGQGAGITKANRRKPTIERREWVYSTLPHSRLYCRDREQKVGHDLWQAKLFHICVRLQLNFQWLLPLLTHTVYKACIRNICYLLRINTL